jgi:hypothetical protein
MIYRHCFPTLLEKSHYEISSKPGWLEIKWYTSAFGCADEVNTRILGGSVHTTKKNAEALVVSSKNSGVE